MKEGPKRKGLLVVALVSIIASVAAIPLTGAGASFAEPAVAGTTKKVEPTIAAETEKPDHFAYIIGYPNGEVKPLAQITREETATIFYRLLAQELRDKYISGEQPFTDVGWERWSRAAIGTLYNAGLVQGYSDGSFLPEKPVTRAEFAAIAARFEGVMEQSDQPAEEHRFPDLANHWGNQYAGTAVGKGWIRGYGDGTFRPDNIIIRSEAMMLVNEALDRRVNLAGLKQDAKQWPDNTENKWYYEIVLEATNTHDYERADRPKSTEKWTGIRPDPAW